MKRAERGQSARGSGLWAYNVRILLGQTYWLIITPVAATQLVIFWNMATATLFSATRAAQTIELLAPILGAFLCAHALAPEQEGVGELVFVRPISAERVLLLRLGAIFAFVYVVLIPALVIYALGIPEFPLGAVLLSSIPSLLFLSLLALAAAAASRRPLIGLGAAGAYWALDMAVGSYFNPLVSLHSYADHLAGRPMSEQWLLSKGALLALAAALYLLTRRRLARPAGPRRWRAIARASALGVAVLLAYVASGAAYKVAYGIRNEGRLGHQARLWYQQQFRGYGPLPVAWLFGPAFPRYVQAEFGRGAPFLGAAEGRLWAPLDAETMRELLARYPASMWADNAQFELARHAARRPSPEPLLVVGYEANAPQARTHLAEGSLEEALAEYRLLVARYPRSAFAPLALVETAAISLLRMEFEAAAEAYEHILADYPDSPQAFEAGLSLSALYLRRGEARAALEAADIASRAAGWDVRAEALVAGARAAERLGDQEGAQERYARALSAARAALERAVRGHELPSRLAKADLYGRANAVIGACEAGLAGRPAPEPPAPGPTALVRGRVVRGGEGAAGVRVGIGASAAPGGLPTPFGGGAAFAAETDEDGQFRIEAEVGHYPAMAFAVTLRRDERDLVVERPSLPLSVQEPETLLPPLSIARDRSARPTPEPPASPQGPPASPQALPQRPGPGRQPGVGGSRPGLSSRGGAPRGR